MPILFYCFLLVKPYQRDRFLSSKLLKTVPTKRSFDLDHILFDTFELELE